MNRRKRAALKDFEAFRRASQRKGDLALRAVIATHLRRHLRAGVEFEPAAEGFLIRSGRDEWTLALNGPNALDGALRQLSRWGLLR